MNTPSTKLLIRSLGVGYFLGLSPYKWDSKNKRLEIDTSLWRQLWGLTLLLLLIGYVIAVGYQAYATPVVSPAAFALKIGRWYMCFSWGLLLPNHYVNFRYGKEFTSLFTGMVGLIERYKSPDYPGKVVTKYAAITTLMDIPVTVITAASVFYSPLNPRVLNSLFSPKDPSALPLYFKLLLSFLHFNVAGFHMFAYWLHFSSVVAYADGVSNVLQTLFPTTGNTQMTNARRITVFMKRYNKLMVLRAHFSAVYGTWMIGVQTFILFFMITHTCIAVLFRRLSSLLLVLSGGALFKYLLYQTAAVHHYSTELLQAWKVQGNGQDDSLQLLLGIIPTQGLDGVRNTVGFFSRYLRSRRPVNVPVGQFFYVDRGLILTTMSIVIDQCASIILATLKK